MVVTRHGSQSLVPSSAPTVPKPSPKPTTKKTKGKAYESRSFLTFPRYLAVQINRYYLSDKWVPEKHEVEIPIPEKIDIGFMKGKGFQENEKKLPKAGAKKSKEADPGIVATLMSLGFSENASKKAALQHSNPDMAAAWLFEHSQDEGINDPIKEDKEEGEAGGFKADPEMVQMLSLSLGFTPEQVTVALTHTKGDGQRAADWLFSHENLDDAICYVPFSFRLLSIVVHNGTKHI